MKSLRMVVVALLFMSASPTELVAQEFVEKITKAFEFSINKKAAEKDSTIFENKVVLAPVAVYEPAITLGMGIGAKFLFKPKGTSPETRTSNLPLSVLYTLRNQFIFESGYTVFFNEEKYLLKGSLDFSKFPLSYYGVGSLQADENKTEIAFNNILVEPLLLKRVFKDVFVGGGIRYNYIYNTRLEETVDGVPKGTSLQDSLGSTSAGLELAITYDSRDNVLNAGTGNFLEFTHGFYGKAFGGTHKFMLSKLDFRQYFKPFKNRPDILAFEWYTRIAWSDTPPLELSALGGPILLRGFQEGRFRDRIAFFAQSEYRWQALDRIGFTFFAGMGDVTNSLSEAKWQNLKYSMGGGLRLKIIKSENLNIRFDYAFGLGNIQDQNFYVGIAEVF
ncbi:MAG: BamA/TamA family outer membrane protein [Bacteroidota bacterium]